MANANCTIVGRRTSSNTYDTANSAYVGYGNLTTPELYPYWLMFTAPEFVGVSSVVKFSLSMYGFKRNGNNSSSVNLRWALCSSDENINSYNTANAVSNGVSDPNQIASGTVTFDGLSSSISSIKTLTIQTTALKPGVSYFLVLWGDSSAGYVGDTATMNAASNHSVLLEYGSGVVRIRVGNEWKAATPHIWKGGKWVLAIPGIWKGSEWRITI